MTGTIRPVFSPDGKMLAHGYQGGVEVRHLDQARPGLLLDHKSYMVGSQTFSPDSKTLATACFRMDRESGQQIGEIRLWNLESGRVDQSLPGIKGRIPQLAFSPDGNTLAALTGIVGKGVNRIEPGEVKLWDLATGKEQAAFPGTGMAFAPDGRTLAVVGNDRTLKLMDRGSGREVLQLKGQETADFVTFSPDGRSLFFDGAVWELATGRPICRLDGNDPHAFFSPDGKRLFSVTLSFRPAGLLRVWDATTGDLLLVDKVPAAGTLAVHPDGWRCAVSAGISGTWLVDARPLTPELRRQREAHNLVAYLFRKPMLKEDVLAFVRRLQTISEPVRQEALVLAQQPEHDVKLLNDMSTDVIVESDRTPEEYREALKWAAEAHRLEPEQRNIANTYGVALYRAGKYEEAVAALERSQKLNKGGGAQFAYDLLFQAMAQWQLGRHDEARATLDRIRDPKSRRRVMLRHWREAEALIEGKTAGPKK
jgi:hypothetical protein